VLKTPAGPAASRGAIRGERPSDRPVSAPLGAELAATFPETSLWSCEDPPADLGLLPIVIEIKGDGTVLRRWEDDGSRPDVASLS